MTAVRDVRLIDVTLRDAHQFMGNANDNSHDATDEFGT